MKSIWLDISSSVGNNSKLIKMLKQMHLSL